MSTFFPHVKPSKEAREAMSAAALELDAMCCAHRSAEVREAIEAVSKATKHKYVKLVSSGSAALMAALKGLNTVGRTQVSRSCLRNSEASAKDSRSCYRNGKVIIPDQGAWSGFKKYPKLFGIEAVEIPTNLGIIEPETLLDEIKKHRPKGVLLTSFAGYIAEQDVKEISSVCRENGVLLVEDASGAIGDERLADGRYADVIVCSTGSPKILNVLSGGFISTSSRSILDMSVELINACKISPVTCAGITEELKRSPEVVRTLIKYSRELKGELDNIVHREKRGVCVGFELKGDPAKFIQRAREKGLKTEFGTSFLTSCPRYDRFMKRGVVVELKKLDILNIEYERVIGIARVLKLCTGE